MAVWGLNRLACWADGLVTNRTPAPSPAFLRYAAVGALATAAHWAMLVLLAEAFAVRPFVASGVGALLGAQVAFWGNWRFTFGHDGDCWPAWWRFMATACVGALLGVLLVALLAGTGAVGATALAMAIAWPGLGWHYLAAQALATLLVLLLTYAVNKRWSFRSKWMS
jgi:putative flippase GtrA